MYTWKCADCAFEEDLSYSEVVECGTPQCPTCDHDMLLIGELSPEEEKWEKIREEKEEKWVYDPENDLDPQNPTMIVDSKVRMFAFSPFEYYALFYKRELNLIRAFAFNMVAQIEEFYKEKETGADWGKAEVFRPMVLYRGSFQSAPYIGQFIGIARLPFFYQDIEKIDDFNSKDKRIWLQTGTLFEIAGLGVQVNLKSQNGYNPYKVSSEESNEEDLY